MANHYCRGISYRDRIAKDVAIDSIVEEIGIMYNREPAELFASRYKHDNVRRIAIYLSKRLTDSAGTEVGRRFGISCSCVAMTAKDIELMMLSDNKLKKRVKKIILHFELK